jgi:nitrogen fixation/metabolism regulation signal transduction histidine kinase
MKGTKRNFIYAIFLAFVLIIFPILSKKILFILEGNNQQLAHYLIFQFIALFIIIAALLFVVLKSVLYYFYENKKKLMGRRINRKFSVIIFILIFFVSVPFIIYNLYFTNFLLKQWGGKVLESSITSSVKFSQKHIESSVNEIIFKIDHLDKKELEKYNIHLSSEEFELKKDTGRYENGKIYLSHNGAVYETDLSADEIDFFRTLDKNYNSFKKDISFRKRASKLFLAISIIVITVLLFAITFWIAKFLGKDIILSIEKLLEGTMELQNGNFDVKIQKVSDDELGLLIDRFNEMSLILKRNQNNLENLKSEIEKERDFQKLILSLINTGIIIINKKNTIIFENQTYKNIKNATREKEKFRQILFQIVDDYKRNNINKKRIRFKDHFYQIMLIPFTYTYRGYIIIIEDVTELLHLRQGEIWQEMAKQLMHELKNPLTPISLSIERLKRKFIDGSVDFNDIFIENLDMIKEEVERLSRLLNHFNNFARMPKAVFKEFNLKKLLTNSIKLYELDQEKNIKIRFNYNCKDEIISGDKLLFKQVLVNLFKNSIESIGEKLGEIIITVNENDEFVTILFKDNGIGIKKEELSKIFDLYYSKKKGGTGLGLTMVRRIIDEHSGNIRVESTVGKGTTFKIQLRRRAI